MKNNLIVRFDFARLRNETHVEMHDSVDFLFTTHYSQQQLGIVPQYNTYKKMLENEKLALDIIFKSVYTQEIYAQDEVRNKIYRGFVDAVKSSVNHFNEDKKTAASHLYFAIKHYGNINSRNLDQTTAAFSDLIRELETGTYPANLQLLELTDWITHLQTENDKFSDLMQARYEEWAQRPSVRMKSARNDTDKAFRALLDQIDALVLVNGITNYEPFIRSLNAITERYKNILAQHSKKRTGNAVKEVSDGAFLS